MNFPVFDLHCDTASQLVRRKVAGADDTLNKNTLHIDLERAAALPGYGQCFACFTTTRQDPGVDRGPSPLVFFERQMDAIFSQVEANSDKICLAFSGKDVQQNYEKGLMSAVMTIEGPAGFGFDPALLEDLYKVGFRITTLGWNEKNVLTGSNITGGGLTDMGREFVEEAQRLGMLIDVSHISDEGFWDIMEITQAPVIASHSNSRRVCNVSRNLTDEMFLEICKTGGVAGMNLYSSFVGENPDIDTFCDHIFHFLELDPSGKHISLGGDLDGCESLPKGISGLQDYPKIAQRLLERGLTEEMISDIYWNNAVGVIGRCCI